MSFSLPKDIAGSFSFDENPKEENKLINIEARENRWNLYTTTSVSVLSNDVPISAVALAINSFYVLKRNDKKYLIYVTSLNLGNAISSTNLESKLSLISLNTKLECSIC